MDLTIAIHTQHTSKHYPVPQHRRGAALCSEMITLRAQKRAEQRCATGHAFTALYTTGRQTQHGDTLQDHIICLCCGKHMQQPNPVL